MDKNDVEEINKEMMEVESGNVRFKKRMYKEVDGKDGNVLIQKIRVEVVIEIE